VDTVSTTSPPHNFPRRSRPVRLLVVDHDPGALHALTGTLEYGLAGQVTLTTCDTGLQALQCATATRYATIVADVRLPEMTGLDLLMSVRQVQPNTPFVLMSGCPDRAMITQAIDAGLSDFIAKPIDRVVFCSPSDRHSICPACWHSSRSRTVDCGGPGTAIGERSSDWSILTSR
jgi:CheY-like chemotaxis protein